VRACRQTYITEQNNRSDNLQKTDLEFALKLSENLENREKEKAQRHESLEKKLQPVWFA